MNPLPSPRRVAVPVLVRDGKACQAGGGMNSSLKSDSGVGSIGSGLSEFAQFSGLGGPCLPPLNGMPANYSLMHHQHPWW